MGKSQQTFGKKEREKKKLKKRQEKQLKKEERKANNNKGGSLDDMLVYVDEFGRLVDTPPDPKAKKEVDANSIELGVPKKEDIPFDAERRGKVAFFNHDKGYGFITESQTGEKYFVHATSLLEPVSEHDKVTFRVEQGDRGLSAIQVEKAR